jgi:hypothetical protein
VKRSFVGLLVVLALVLLISPGIVGRLAEKNFEQDVEWAGDDSSDFVVTTEKFDRGWFSSEGRHRVTLRPSPLQASLDPGESMPSLVIDTRIDLLAASLAQREALLTQLSSLGIGAGRMYQQPLPKIFPHIADASFPGATQVAERLLTLPTHHYLRETDIAKIAHTFRTEEPTRKAH